MSRTASIKKPERSWLLSSLFISTVLLAAALAAYWNSFAVPLVFDDMVTIQRNTQVRFGEFGWNLISPRAILYKTFTLNYLVSGQEVWTYHLINFILHFLNGVLIFLIASRLFGLLLLDKARCRAYAALGAAFFLLHPVQTESVTYISSRSELLSTSFYLAGFLIFMLWPKDRGFYCSLAVGITYFFGLGSKETVVTLPATIFAYDYLFLSNAEFRPVFSRWRFYLTYVAGASGAIIYLLTKGLKGTVGGISWWVYFLTETRVLVRYVQLIFFPAGLNLDYDFRLSFSVFEPAVLACIGLLASILFLSWYVRRSAPVVAFSIFWFFITISPTSSVGW